MTPILAIVAAAVLIATPAQIVTDTEARYLSADYVVDVQLSSTATPNAPLYASGRPPARFAVITTAECAQLTGQSRITIVAPPPAAPTSFKLCGSGFVVARTFASNTTASFCEGIQYGQLTSPEAIRAVRSDCFHLPRVFPDGCV